MLKGYERFSKMVERNLGIDADKFIRRKRTRRKKMSTTRCKFICNSVKQNWTTLYKNGHSEQVSTFEYEFNAVSGGSEENRQFFSATPNGSLKFFNTNGPQKFETGKKYYLDITSCLVASEV